MNRGTCPELNGPGLSLPTWCWLTRAPASCPCSPSAAAIYPSPWLLPGCSSLPRMELGFPFGIRRGADKEAGQGGEESWVINKSSHSNLHSQTLLTDLFLFSHSAKGPNHFSPGARRDVPVEASSDFSLLPELTIPHFLASRLSCYPHPIWRFKTLPLTQGFQLYLREKYLPQLDSTPEPNTLEPPSSVKLCIPDTRAM